jgi:MFS family permease
VSLPLSETRASQGSWRSRLGTFPLWQPLRVRDFSLVWAGESISVLGDQFYLIALAWLALQLTGSPLALGTVLMAAAIPRGTLMLVGGALTDRIAPRTLMAASNGLRAVLVGAVAALVLTRHAELWQLYVLGVCFGIVDAVFYPAVAAIVPALVETEQLPAGNALVQGTAQIMGLIGPALAGTLIAATGSLGLGTAFAFDAASFALATGTALALRSSGRMPAHAEPVDLAQSNHQGFLRSILDGLRYVIHDPVLRPLLLLTAIVNFAFAGPFGVGFAALAHNRFGGAAALGAMFAAEGAGNLLGTAVGGSRPAPRRRGWAAIGTLSILAMGLLAIAAAPSALLAVPTIFLMSIANGYVNILFVPWLQQRADPLMLGRVMSLVMVAGMGLTPVSYAAGGALASINVTLLFVCGASLTAVAVLIAALSGPIRRMA